MSTEESAGWKALQAEKALGPEPEDPAHLPVLNRRQFGTKPTVFFHGTVRDHKVGDVIPSGFSGMDREYPTNHHDNPQDALADARNLHKLSHNPDVAITTPTVYQTEAIGTPYPVRHGGGKQWQTSKGFRVTGIAHRDPQEYTDAVNNRQQKLRDIRGDQSSRGGIIGNDGLGD